MRGLSQNDNVLTSTLLPNSQEVPCLAQRSSAARYKLEKNGIDEVFRDSAMRAVMHFWILVICVIPGTYHADNTVTCIRAIDGDTLVLKKNNHIQRYRLIGIDTAETKDSAHLDWQTRQWNLSKETGIEWGMKAKKILSNLCQNNPKMRIEVDEEKKDRYHRPLVYVFLSDGTFVNEWMLQQNLAHIFFIPPNLTYQERLAKAWKSIKETKKE